MEIDSYKFEINNALSEASPWEGKYRKVFMGLGCAKNFKLSASVNSDVPPTIAKARPISFAMQKLVEREIDHLLQLGVIEKADITIVHWVSPHAFSWRKTAKLDYSLTSVSSTRQSRKITLPTAQP